MEQNNIEVEIRGRLSTDEYDNLLSFLKKEGTYKETKNRLLLDYSTFLPEEGVRERTKDIRLRITNGLPEIITKIGAWGGDESRKELSIMTEEGSFETLVQNYACLGYTKAILAIRNSQVFHYKEIEFALVEVPEHSYYFEAELMIAPGGEAAALEKLKSVCNDLSLNIFDDKGFYTYIEELNQEANKIFDYAEYTEGYFEKYISGHHAEIKKDR